MVAAAVRDFDADVPLVVLAGPGGALMAEAAEAAGLRVVLEAFPDRAYLDDGQLAPRSLPGAVLHDPEEIATRALMVAQEGVIISRSGKRVPLAAQTLCLHGDTPYTAAAARGSRWRRSRCFPGFTSASAATWTRRATAAFRG